MIGHLYRYPHPFDSDKFIYVGQGSKRDQTHRKGKTSFGRRFKNLFLNVELPQPIREQVEVRDQLELNELETIWMFRYHTWRGYESGMNLTFPGGFDYKNMSALAGGLGGKISGHAVGRKHRENGTGLFSKEMLERRREFGVMSVINQPREVRSAIGKKAVKNKTGIHGLSSEQRRAASIKAGLANVKSGWMSQLGKSSGKRAVESGQLASVRSFEGSSRGGKLGSKKTNHKRRHTGRGIRKQGCAFCRENGGQ
jgi:hypothetical protein